MAMVRSAGLAMTALLAACAQAGGPFDDFSRSYSQPVTVELSTGAVLTGEVRYVGDDPRFAEEDWRMLSLNFGNAHGACRGWLVGRRLHKFGQAGEIACDDGGKGGFVTVPARQDGREVVDFAGLTLGWGISGAVRLGPVGPLDP